MENEFNLSEKLWQNPNDWSFNIDANDVKEFIKKLKEESFAIKDGTMNVILISDLDKFAGEKLI